MAGLTGPAKRAVAGLRETGEMIAFKHTVFALPFAIISQKADKAEMGLFMGLFNLSVVLPQLVVSLGISLAVSRTDDLSLIFIISAVALALSTLSWTRVHED